MTDIQKQVLQYEIPAELFENDMKRRLQWILIHKYEETFKKFKAEWDVLLAANGVKMIPTDPAEYAQLVFMQPNYRSASQRNAEYANQQRD